jgi:transposase
VKTTKAEIERRRAAVGRLLHNPDLTCADIAAELGLTYGCVSAIQRHHFPDSLNADRFNAHPSRSAKASEERRAEVGRLLRDGLDDGEIAYRVGISETTVARIQQEYFPELARKKRPHIKPGWNTGASPKRFTNQKRLRDPI